MSEDYVIEWDNNFADDLNVVANVFYRTTQPYGPLFSLNFRRNLKSLKTKMKTNMGCRTSWIVAVAISEITSWHRHFLQVLRGEGFIHLVDWKGEDEEGELANFAADRFYELNKKPDRF